MRRLRFFLAAVIATAPLMPTGLSAAPDDWGVTRDPFDKNVIARYKAILARNPHDASALAKLLEMYKRYRTIDLLKEEYGKLVEKSPADTSALVVLGRLHKAT